MEVITAAGGFLASYWLVRVDRKIDRLFQLRDDDVEKRAEAAQVVAKVETRVDALEREIFGRPGHHA